MPLSDLSGPICWILSCCIQPLFLFLFPIIMRCKGPPWRAPPLAPPPVSFIGYISIILKDLISGAASGEA